MFTNEIRFVNRLKERVPMTKIGLFYSSSTGNTEDDAKVIKTKFEKLGNVQVDLCYVTSKPLSTMLAYDKLILGISTWNVGELEADWDSMFHELDALDLSGKQVAVFGLGDQYGYADTYQDALGLLAKKVRERGAELVGFTDTTGHDFDESLAVENGRFMGLALDDDNQSELTLERISTWVVQLAGEFKLHEPAGA